MKKKFLSMAALVLALVMTGCSTGNAKAETPAEDTKADAQTEETTDGTGDIMRVSYIDVGQGDSEFIELPDGKTLLIDAGTNESGDDVVEYIKSLGYTSIDYVVGTHPHEDHIGGLDDVINTFDIGDIYLPKASADTKTFEDVMDAITAKNYIVYTAHAGVTIDKDESKNLSVYMVAPVSGEYDELNNFSAVIKIVYGDTSFLFTGDAEELAENEITDDVSADVLKVGHHGSTTSTSQAFLDKVNPSIAVISCGAGNKYGHPNQETLDKLNAKNIEILRTDELGTIVITSDGKTITKEVTTEGDSIAPAGNTDNAVSEVPAEKTYVLNTNSKKIHYADCSSVAKMSESNKEYTDDFQKAIDEGYEAAGDCNPQ